MIEGPYEVHDFTVSQSTTISALTLCTFTSPRTASAGAAGTSGTAAAPIPFAGIMATDKITNDGDTEKGLYNKGVFNLTASPGSTIPAGSLVTMSGANFIIPVFDADALMSGAVVGKAYQEIVGSATGEVHVGEII